MAMTNINWNMIESLATLGGTLLAVIGAFCAYRELKSSAYNSSGEFILNLQDVYTSNNEYISLFEKCWENYLGEIDNATLLNYLTENRKYIVNYMTFFESVYLMTESKVLKMSLLDELFGRRFFVVVNNKTLQDFDLVSHKPYYENVFSLYDKWKAYRFNKGNTDVFVRSDNGECYRDLRDAV